MSGYSIESVIIPTGQFNVSIVLAGCAYEANRYAFKAGLGSASPDHALWQTHLYHEMSGEIFSLFALEVNGQPVHFVGAMSYAAQKHAILPTTTLDTFLLLPHLGRHDLLDELAIHLAPKLGRDGMGASYFLHYVRPVIEARGRR